jgi:hypothetical protein
MRTVIAAVLVVAVCTSSALARTWTDATGKHTLEAEFVELKDGNVQLRKPDGKVVTLPIEKLSQADQAFAKAHAAPAKRTDTANAEKQTAQGGADDSVARGATDASSSLLAYYLKAATISVVQPIPPISVGNGRGLNMKRAERVAQAVPSEKEVQTKWAGDATKAARVCVKRLQQLSPQLRYLGFTFARGVPLGDVEAKYGAPDREADVQYEPEIKGMGTADKLHLKWKWWGWIGLGVDDQMMVQAIRVECKGLLNSKK